MTPQYEGAFRTCIHLKTGEHLTLRAVYSPKTDIWTIRTLDDSGVLIAESPLETISLPTEAAAWHFVYSQGWRDLEDLPGSRCKSKAAPQHGIILMSEIVSDGILFLVEWNDRTRSWESVFSIILTSPTLQERHDALRACLLRMTAGVTKQSLEEYCNNKEDGSYYQNMERDAAAQALDLFSKGY